MPPLLSHYAPLLVVIQNVFQMDRSLTPVESEYSAARGPAKL